MLLGSFRTVIFFQILVDTVEQVRVITLESPRGMQDILDDLFHPLAVSLLREGLSALSMMAAICSGTRFCSMAVTAVVRL